MTTSVSTQDQDGDGQSSRQAPSLTHTQCINRQQEINAELERLGEQDGLSAADDVYFAELREEFVQIDEHRRNLERQADLADIRARRNRIPSLVRFERGAPHGTAGVAPADARGGRSDYDRDAILEPDSIEDCRFRNPWDMSEMRTFGRDTAAVNQELRARAVCAASKMQGASDDVRQAATTIIEQFDDHRATLSRMCLATSSAAYLRAWSKLARNQGHTLSPDEQRAVSEVRAMSLTDSAGGYLVPFQLDPTVIITSAGVRSDIRQVARVVVATGDVWNGVSSTHVSWSWDAEAAEVSDDSTTFAQPSIPNYKAQGFVPISIEALEDEVNVTAEVARLLAGGKLDLEGAAFITGTGSGQPTGIITALVASSPTVIKNSATTDTFALADVYALQGALPARYRPNASWLANNLLYNKIRQFDTAGGAGMWVQLPDDRPPQMIGRAALEAESMDGVIDAGQENYTLLFGDFDNFVITDRIGVSVEFIPHLFGANQRPSGQRGWYAYYRTGSDSVNDGAFRLLDVT